MSWEVPGSISVVIPALDEAGNIGRLVEEVFHVVPEQALAEVIVVDDASRDGTAAEVAALMGRYPRLKLLRHLRRAGQSAAVRTGVRFAQGTLIASMDGDGQNDPRDIAAMAVMLSSAGHETALIGGIRTHRRAEASKRLASRFANGLRDWLLDDGCPDTGCGIKVFRREVFLDLPFFCGMHRYLPALFQAYGHEVAYLPVNDRPRRIGRSMYTNFGRALIGIYDLVGVRWIMRRTRLSPVSTPFTRDCEVAGRLPAPEAASRIGLVRTPEPGVQLEEATAWPRPYSHGGPQSPHAI